MIFREGIDNREEGKLGGSDARHKEGQWIEKKP